MYNYCTLTRLDDVGYNNYGKDWLAIQEGRRKMASHRTLSASLQDDKGTWVVRGRVYNPESGRIHQRSKSTGLKVKDNTKRKAKEMMQQIIAQWQTEIDKTERAASPPFTAYLSLFIKRLESKQRKATTIKSYQDYIDCHIKPKLGNVPIAELTLSDLDYFYEEYLKTHSPNSARRVHVVIRGAIKEAIRDGYFQYNIADYVELPAKLKFTGAAVYSEAEVNTLLGKAKEEGEPIRAAVVLAVCYGLRRSEIIGMRWQDIDFERNTLTVSNTVVQNGNIRIEAEQTKTKKSHRTIGLLPITIPYLKELKKKQEENKVQTDKLVAWEDGRNMRPDYITRKVEQLMKKCGLKVIRLHDLRHTAISLLAPYVSPEQLKDFFGHENISTTFDIYLHVLDDRKKATSTAMNEALKSVSI